MPAVPTPKIESALPVPERPWQRVGTDISGPFAVAPHHQRFIITAVDHKTGFPEYKLNGGITTGTVVDFLENCCSRYGYPEALVSDNGPQFTSDEFATYLTDKDISHIHTPVYNPQTNGKVEVFNRYLKAGIQTFTEPAHFAENVRKLINSYRSTPIHDNGKSPAELLHGRQMRMAYVPVIPEEKAGKNGVAAKDENTNNHEAPTKWLTSRGPYKVENKVLVRRAQVLKGQSPWLGPLEVKEVLGNWTYKLSDKQVGMPER